MAAGEEQGCGTGKLWPKAAAAATLHCKRQQPSHRQHHSAASNYLAQPPLCPLPTFLPVQILFGAMFAFADNFYNGPVATVAHAIMSATLTQVRASCGACCSMHVG